ncbi:MAG: ribulose-phosphate 3-epimerase [Acholeplasmatales bacterium]|nr:ribulose-phosphate 3-epimerase [Acholeplasmatales bacterium]
MKVSLSILTVDYANVEKSLAPLLNDLDYIHLDVMDGVFVPNISFGYSFIKSLRKITNLPFDTHLMIQNPISYIKNFAEAGSQYITFHYEASSDVMETINLIKSYNVKAGISIKPNTTVEEIEHLLPYLDMVLIMSVEPGFGGQKFMPSSIDKVKRLSQLKNEKGYNYLINIDGGINGETAKLVSDYCDLVVSGSYVVNAEEPLENLNVLKNI